MGAPNGGRRVVRHGVATAITVNAAVIRLVTSVTLAVRFGGGFDLASQAFLAIFVVEALIKMGAVWPRLRDYFADPGTCSTSRSLPSG